MNISHAHIRSCRGAGLIVVILMMAFLMAGGLVLISITGTGSKTAGNVRQYQEAFNAAEAGFDASWFLISGYVNGAMWADFSGHYLQTPPAINDPQNVDFFRTKSDEEILAAINGSTNGVLFYQQQYVKLGAGTDPRFTYTAFLIDNDLMAGATNPKDVLLVLIGCVRAGGTRIISTSRIEVELGL